TARLPLYALSLHDALPIFSSGVAAAVLGDWRVSSFLTVMSGLPLYFTDSNGSLLAPDNTQTPQLVAPVKILHGIGPGNPWFSTRSEEHTSELQSREKLVCR